MRRLRIAVVTPELPNGKYPHRGLSIYQTLQHLREHVELQAICPLPHYPAGLRPRRFDYRESDLQYSLPGVATHYFDYPAVPVVTRPINGLTCAHYLEPVVRAFQPDIILNFWLYPAGFAAMSVARKLHIPGIVGSIGSDLNAIPDPVSRWLTKRTLSWASRVIVKSEQLRRRAVAMGADSKKTHLIVNGCDESVFHVRDRNLARRELDIPPSTKLIAFVGRMNRAKGIGELLEAVGVLSRIHPDLRLVYVGDGPEERAMRERVRDSNVAANVHFAGACTSAEVAQWLAAANLLAVPSHAEGCPNAVIEALSCGRPVVATHVGGIPELVDSSCGLLVPVRNPAALVDALNAGLNFPWDESAIGGRFRRGWGQVAEEVLAVCLASRREWN